jgi:hypothetical protein
MRFKYSNPFINVGAANDDALDLAIMAKAKFTVRNASIMDNAVKSKHAEAFATDDLQGLHLVTLFDFFEQNKVIISAVTRASDPSEL